MTIVKSSLKNLFIWVGNSPGREKITIGSGISGIHYTLVFKKNKRVVDIHKTIESSNEKKYERFLEMRFFTFIRFIIIFSTANMDLLREFWLSNRINLGRLRRHNLLLLPLLPDQNIINLLIDNKRKKKIKFKDEIEVNSLLKAFLYPHQILERKENSFFVYSTKKGQLRKQGIIFRIDTDRRERSFYFLTDTRHKQYLKTTQIVIFNILNHLDFENKTAIMACLHKNLSKNPVSGVHDDFAKI